MRITIQEVNTTFTKKGKNGWYTADVTYTDQKEGKNFTKKLQSFTNPTVYEAVKEAGKGTQFEVDIKKEGDFWNWVGITPVSGEAPAKASTPSAGGKAAWETPQERLARQLYIIKQSSLTNAVATVNATDDAGDVDKILEVAQQFVEFVYGSEDMASLDGDRPD